MEDSFAQILVDAKKTRTDAAEALAALTAGAAPPPAMTRTQAIAILVV